MKKLKFITIAMFLICIVCTAKSNSRYDSKRIKDSIEIKIDTIIAQMGLSSETPGGVVGVIKNRKIIFMKAYGLSNFETKEPNKTSTLFNLGSVSKQFTAAAILILAKEKKLSLNDDIRKYLPDFPDYGYTITIENLVHHTCGIRSNDVLTLMAGTLDSIETQEEIYSLIIKQKSLNFKPGDEFLYSNSGYVLLVKIIEKTSGMKFSKFIEQNIFQPVGMNQTTIYDNPGKIIKNSASGHTWGGDKKFKRTGSRNSTVVGQSNIYTCVEDFLQWDNNFYNNKLGKWDFTKEMTSQTTLSNGDTCRYAFGLDISEHNGLKTISHQGGTGDFTAQYVQIPSEKFAVVCLFNIPIDVTGLAYKITDLFVKGKPQTVAASLHPEKAIVDSVIFETYVGKYFDENRWLEATITKETDHLVFDGPYQDKFEIYPSSDTSFFATVADLKFIFNKDAKGETAKVTIVQGDQKFPLAYLGTNIFPLKTEQLSQYAGDFYSEEINATYPVLFKDNKLFVKFPQFLAPFCKNNVEAELISEYADYFASPISGFHFTRNAQNEISGFIIKDVGRVRNLVFSKVK
ncbi:MAG TPA: serine hydrolase [Anaerovoracaceae bacterium]|nr:serine hydrolase [Anaerovoracaceae bacterium]